MENCWNQNRIRPYDKNESNYVRRSFNNNNLNHERFATGRIGKIHRNERNRIESEATRPIGYRTLENVLRIEGDAEIILKLSSRKNGFLLLLDQQNIPTNLMCLIVAALAKVSECSTEQDMVQLLRLFYVKIIPKLNIKSNFYRELSFFIGDLNNIDVQTYVGEEFVNALKNLIIFLRRLHFIVYERSFDAVQNLTHLITAQIDYMNRKGNSLNEHIIELVNQLNQSVENFMPARDEMEMLDIWMETSEDFRKINIYPDIFDIFTDHEPIIRQNLIEGKYVDGIDHYLDVQFRLLREDFVRPLRNGINEYIYIQHNPEAWNLADDFRIENLNIYQNVQIFGSKMLHNEQIHSCKFDCTPFYNIRWQVSEMFFALGIWLNETHLVLQCSKRLMTGSLVCLSADNFRTIYFGTVAGRRDPVELQNGQFQIKFELESSAMPEIMPFVRYVMLELLVYFEAYRHNLKVLQEFSNDNFPLKRYIVDVNNDILPPSYLSENSVYQISNGLPDTDAEAKISSVKVLNQQQWPPREEFQLDESQYEAFRAALTKQLAIIQGPPGGFFFFFLMILLINFSHYYSI